MPSVTTKLTKAQVERIKARIYYGALREIVAIDFGVSLSLVCAIGSGWRWKDVKWPDGSFGALDPKRAKIIDQARHDSRDAIESVVKRKIKELEKAA